MPGFRMKYCRLFFFMKSTKLFFISRDVSELHFSLNGIFNFEKILLPSGISEMSDSPQVSCFRNNWKWNIIACFFCSYCVFVCLCVCGELYLCLIVGLFVCWFVCQKCLRVGFFGSVLVNVLVLVFATLIVGHFLRLWADLFVCVLGCIFDRLCVSFC